MLLAVKIQGLVAGSMLAFSIEDVRQDDIVIIDIEEEGSMDFFLANPKRSIAICSHTNIALIKQAREVGFVYARSYFISHAIEIIERRAKNS